MSETVAAIIVTYNRKDLLAECLDALLSQTRPVDKILIIDNASTDGTTELLTDRGFINNATIEYTRLLENTGGAGGFHEGVKRGYEAGHDWLWLMDDDARPELTTLSTLIDCAHHSKAGVACPLIVSNLGHLELYHHKIIRKFPFSEKSVFHVRNVCPGNSPVDIDANAFVGPLFSRQCVSDIGFPKKEMFIWGDDTEYTIRAKLFGHKVILCPNSKIIHFDNYDPSVSNLKKIEHWKVYYGVRNRVYIAKLYFGYLSACSVVVRTCLSCFSVRMPRSLCIRKIKALLDGVRM